MVPLGRGDEVFLVVPLRRRERGAYDGDNAVVFPLDNCMLGMPEK